MNIIKNQIIVNNTTKSFLADAFYPSENTQLPLVIFMHGYKGYKDWGAWNLMCQEIASQGFYVVSFNTSHNGTSLEKTSKFSDLDSFGDNNYSKELSDIRRVCEFFSTKKNVDETQISLIGHSRGGGLAIIEAFENQNIKNLITLAAVSSLNRFPKDEKLEDWKNKGVYYVFNGRTQQQMPHKYQFLEDFLANEKRFSIENCCKNLNKSHLIIHGSEDTSVDHYHAELLHKWSSESHLETISDTNHTFGTKEPWDSVKLPFELKKITEFIITFLKNEL